MMWQLLSVQLTVELAFGRNVKEESREAFETTPVL